MHLTVIVPPGAALQLQRLLPPIAPAQPEYISEVIAALGNRGECYCLGMQCACDLFRSGMTRTQQLERKAKRDHWSAGKLNRALQNVGEDWTGLHPEVRHALAHLAENVGQVTVFLFWTGKGGRTEVDVEREVDTESFRMDPTLVATNRLVKVMDRKG